MKREIIHALEKIVGKAHLATSTEECACYSFDGTGRSFMPEAVAFPDSPGQISGILRLANRYRFPVIPRGAGSGMTGGSLPVRGGLVLAMGRMNRIIEIDTANMIAVVEPGVITGELQARLARHRLKYPPDPASLKFCSLGGNVAECAGGPSAVKYGVTRDYVIGLEVVLPTGEIMRTGVRTEKGVVGYDLTRLFIGSEGTLGVFTRLVLRLVPLPAARETFLLTFSSLRSTTTLVAALFRTGLTPCTLEYMDATAIQVVRDRLDHPPPPRTQALLILEFDGSHAEVARQRQRLEEFLKGQDLTCRRAESDTEREELWQARRSISPATFALRPDKISEDVVVPRSRIPDLVEFTSSLAGRYGLTILTFGHAGDGNIHVNIMFDRRERQEQDRALAARKELFRQVVELGGTLSGEHGIGITKSAFLPMEVDPVALDLMQRIKHLFDPAGILNPGKIFSQFTADSKVSTPDASPSPRHLRIDRKYD